MALLLFSAFSALALVLWFHRYPAAWTWKSVLAAGCAALAVATSALVWLTPSRGHAVLGIAIMLASLARIGPPGDWTGVTFALVAITFVLVMPLVHAASVLRRD